MKYHKLPLIAAFAAFALSAFAADTKDQMITKIIGQPPTSSAAAGKPPYAIAAHALVGKDNSIAVNAWDGSLVFQGATWNQYTTRFRFTDPTANRTITFPNSSGTVLLTAIDDWVFEGTTADAYETTITAVDPTADGTIYLPNTAVGIADANLSFVVSTINSGLNAPGLATSVWTGVSAVYFEGATADTSEAALDSADVTADVIYRLADAAAGTYGFVSSTLATNAPDIANSVTGASNSLVFEGTADANEIAVTAADATADVNYQHQDAPAGTYPIVANVVQARTVTADGTTTGTISAGVSHVTVTSDDANKILILPAPVVGKQIVIHAGATGFELRSSAPDTIAINGGTGAAAESAIAANSTCFLTCVTATAWKGYFMDADGDVAKIEAAAP